MKKRLLLALGLMTSIALCAQDFHTDKAKFHWGDDASWKSQSFNDADWQEIPVGNNWSAQGINREYTYAWYRVHFTPTEAWFKNTDQKKVVNICVAYIDDVDETYLNGERIGGMGRFHDNPAGYTSSWSTLRTYTIDASKLQMNKDNVIAVRVWNEAGDGGMFRGSEVVQNEITVTVPSRIDGLKMSSAEKVVNNKKMVEVNLKNEYAVKQQGTLVIRTVNPETQQATTNVEQTIKLNANKTANILVDYPQGNERIEIVYNDTKLEKSKTIKFYPKYILTPKAPESPRFNMAGVFGVRPNSPVIYRLPVSGVRPMKFTVRDLPAGLSLDAENGIISGKLSRQGDYTLNITAENAKGKAEAQLTIKVGSTIALTPPMGWNSWNCWGLSVSQERVMSSAQALIDKGLADYGYSYINVDDAWEAEARNADGTIAVNEKFPDMKALGDWLHSNGLKFGIYSSPGDYTCGGYLGSIDHELQDAETYNSWGVDYLKYDWCGYGSKHATEPDNRTMASYVRPYLLMERHLRAQPRDIFYSLCQYGMQEVWKWGKAVDANSWRTTGDITDTWESLYDIGFCQQTDLYPYAEPGHWNDPDMLIVGKVGWSDNLRDSRLTPDEQYTHISLWALLASNMLIGCDLAQLDDFTINLLCNNEVNAVNQDVLGQQAQRVVNSDGIQVWMRPLSDGSKAIGIFNLNEKDTTIDVAAYLRKLGMKHTAVRDLWRQQDVSNLTMFIPTHGVKLLKISE